MPERVPTGGVKEFIYSKEDMKRIRSEDTESTVKFKQALGEWSEKRQAEKTMQKERSKIWIYLGIGFAIVLCVFMLFLIIKK